MISFDGKSPGGLGSRCGLSYVRRVRARSQTKLHVLIRVRFTPRGLESEAASLLSPCPPNHTQSAGIGEGHLFLLRIAMPFVYWRPIRKREGGFLPSSPSSPPQQGDLGRNSRIKIYLGNSENQNSSILHLTLNSGKPGSIWKYGKRTERHWGR